MLPRWIRQYTTRKLPEWLKATDQQKERVSIVNHIQAAAAYRRAACRVRLARMQATVIRPHKAQCDATQPRRRENKGEPLDDQSRIAGSVLRPPVDIFCTTLLGREPDTDVMGWQPAPVRAATRRLREAHDFGWEGSSRQLLCREWGRLHWSGLGDRPAARGSAASRKVERKARPAGRGGPKAEVRRGRCSLGSDCWTKQQRGRSPCCLPRSAFLAVGPLPEHCSKVRQESRSRWPKLTSTEDFRARARALPAATVAT
jgi:hypothetical protein